MVEELQSTIAWIDEQFQAGEFLPLPWSLPITPETQYHYAHRKGDDPKFIYYFQSEDRLRRRVYTVVKPGRYLQTFYSAYYPADTITSMASFMQINDPSLELRFIKPCPADANAETIAALQQEWIDLYKHEVYSDKEVSCMRGKKCVRVYVYPGNGIGLAYLVNKQGKIMGRSIITERQGQLRYLRLYGADESGHYREVLKHYLEQAGYKRRPDLEGFKLARIPGKGNPMPKGTEEDFNINTRKRFAFVCPFIDSASRDVRGIVDRHTHLLVTTNDKGDFIASSTNGYVWADKVACACCGELFHSSELYSAANGRVCGNCRDEYYVEARHYYYRYDQEYSIHLTPREETVLCEDDGEYYLNAYNTLDSCGVGQCGRSGLYYLEENLVEQADGERIHRRFVEPEPPVVSDEDPILAAVAPTLLANEGEEEPAVVGSAVQGVINQIREQLTQIAEARESVNHRIGVVDQPEGIYGVSRLRLPVESWDLRLDRGIMLAAVEQRLGRSLTDAEAQAILDVVAQNASRENPTPIHVPTLLNQLGITRDIASVSFDEYPLIELTSEDLDESLSDEDYRMMDEAYARAVGPAPQGFVDNQLIWSLADDVIYEVQPDGSRIAQL